MAGVGRLLHNSSGAWVLGFSLHMGITYDNIAELGAVRQDLILAYNSVFKFIHFEIDSMTVLSRLITDKDISPDTIPLLCDYRNLMECDRTVQVCHIFREVNDCVDALAKRGNQ